MKKFKEQFEYPEGFEFKLKPFKHQDNYLKSAWRLRVDATLFDMGLGKTKVTLDTAGMLAYSGKIDSLIVLAPKGVYANWEKTELPKHMSPSVQYKAVLWKGLSTKKNVNELIPIMKHEDNILHILIMNYDAVITEKGKYTLEKFMQGHESTMMVCDESTKIKNPKAKRTKQVISLGLKAKCKRILTGSPITKSPLDFYSQALFLSKECLGFSNFFAFRNRYAILEDVTTFGGASFKKVVGFKNLNELSDKIETFSHRIMKEECLDLPDKTYLVRYFSLTSEQRKLYEEMKKTMMLDLEDDMVSTSIALTKLLRMRQICSGYCPTDQGDVLRIEHKRLETLMDCVEEIDGKIIIWAYFVDDIESIAAALRKEYGDESVVTYYGKTELDERTQNIHRFENDPECRFFVANPKVGGMGITLNAAKYAIFYNADYNYEDRMQAEARNYRIGQKENIFYIDIVAEDTIEQEIVQALINKYEIATEVLRDKLLEWLKI